MDFTESVKLDAKRRANFQCVICRRAGFFLHVHHITPQEEGGPGDLDNAAPLCVECHDLHGGDPGKRKWIREVRDWWWDYCAKRAAQPDVTAAFERLDRLQTELLAVKEGQARSGELLAEVKSLVVAQLQNTVMAVSSARTVQDVVQATSSAAMVTPGTAGLTLTGFAPTVGISTAKKPKP